MPPTPEALAAIRAWVSLDAAIVAFGRQLEAEHGVTGAQLGILRIAAELADPTLATLRERLALHPATLGQLIDRLARKGFVSTAADPADRRRRRIRLTDDGRRLLASAPVAGPVRLRAGSADALDPGRLRRLADALTDAIDLFGLEEWVP